VALRRFVLMRQSGDKRGVTVQDLAVKGALGLIALILGQGYGRALGAFRRDPALGALLVAYVVTAVPYNITEAGFRMGHMTWFFLLLSVLAAN
jgi:hypothetical protein